MKLSRRVQVVMSTLAVVFILGSAYAWIAYIDHTYRNTYGANPRLGWGVESEGPASTEYCLTIYDVIPKAHRDLLGRMWQEENIFWEDVEILIQGSHNRPHGKDGPVRPGDTLCDFPISGFVFVYKPTGEFLVESY